MLGLCHTDTLKREALKRHNARIGTLDGDFSDEF